MLLTWGVFVALVIYRWLRAVDHDAEYRQTTLGYWRDLSIEHGWGDDEDGGQE